MRLWISAALMAAVIVHGALAQEPPSDMVLRASFCKGALDKGIELFSLTHFNNAHQEAIAAGTVDTFTRNRERLQRFLLPFSTDQHQQQPLTAAMLEGARLYQECDTAIRGGPTEAINSETCIRVKRCFDLNWLPD